MPRLHCIASPIRGRGYPALAVIIIRQITLQINAPVPPLGSEPCAERGGSAPAATSAWDAAATGGLDECRTVDDTPCGNATKSNRPPTTVELRRLANRNAAIMSSLHPLRRTLEMALRARGYQGRPDDWWRFLTEVVV